MSRRKSKLQSVIHDQVDDRRVESVRLRLNEMKAFKSELEIKRLDVIKWIQDNGMDELFPAMAELKAKHGNAYAVSSLHAALIGGEFDGVSFDALNPTIDELADAIQYGIEDKCSIRGAIKAMRMNEQDTSGF